MNTHISTAVYNGTAYDTRIRLNGITMRGCIAADDQFGYVVLDTGIAKELRVKARPISPHYSIAFGHVQVLHGEKC